MRFYSWVLPVLLAQSLCPGQEFAPPPGEDRPLRERFAVPPAGARILPIRHILPTEPDAQDAMLRDMAEKGFGGMATNVNFDQYLKSDAYWEDFTRVLGEAKKLGMSLWLYDERGYPSGNAGGQTMEGHPEWEARGLMIAQAESRGGAVALDCPPGDLFRAAAFPVKEGRLDLAGAVDLGPHVAERKLSWNAPEGLWRVMAITEGPLYEGTHAQVSLCDKLPYVNLLMPEPTARFLELTHGAYAARLGDDLGQWFVSTFTDEPSLMSLYMRPQPWSVLPWAPNLPGEFERRRGYPLAPAVPHLVWGGGAEAAKIRHDFWKTVGELVSENYFGQIQEWCAKHRIRSGGHLLLEEAILTHVPLYGDFFACLRRLDAPSMDCLTSIPSEVPWQVGRLVSSAAGLCGREVTMSESSDHSQHWRPEGDTRPRRLVTEAEVRGSLNRLLVSGITTFTSYYTFNGLTPEELVRLNEWTGRCGAMLKGGVQVADTAVLYPAETMAARFLPSRDWVRDAPAGARQVQETYDIASRALYLSGRDFTYVDGRALAEAEVRDGTLRAGGMAWRVVVLPCADTLPIAAWRNLRALWKSGGAVVALGALPENSESEFPCAEARGLAAEMFGGKPAGTANPGAAGGFALLLDHGQEGLLARAVDAAAPPHVLVPKDSPLRTTHRRIDGREVYFIINDGGEPWGGEIGLRAEGAGEQWNPADGTVSPVADPAAIPLQLEPHGGMLFRFEKAAAPERGASAPALLNGLAPAPLPLSAPVAGMGAHVAGTVEPAAAEGRWTAKASLTKGGVDTFLFLTFSSGGDMALADGEFLVFDVDIPAGQECGKTLLVILRDANGVEYLADTHVLIGGGGAVRIFTPLNQFARAGWETNPPGALDWARVRDIRVGWGGYTGREGETVVFTTSAPGLVR